MKKYTDSKYPKQVDDLVFFQDVSIDNKPVMDHFQNLYSNKRYSQARDYINSQADIDGYFAGLYMMLEDRTYKLQQHISAHPHYQLGWYGETCEYEINDGEVWIDMSDTDSDEEVAEKMKDWDKNYDTYFWQNRWPVILANHNLILSVDGEDPDSELYDKWVNTAPNMPKAKNIARVTSASEPDSANYGDVWIGSV